MISNCAPIPLMLYLLVVVVSNLLGCIEALHLLNRTSFPDGFLFGTGSSAYQYEGATRVDGRAPSIWDTFVIQNPEKIVDHSTGDVADEFYYFFKRDIALMKEVGLDSFKLSISWPRVLPGGKVSRGINWQGVKFYNFLIDELLSNGIQPFATIFHWDLPQVLEDEYGGFLSPQIVNDFRDYADFCFKEFGDRVKYWITVNEANLLSKYGYATGEYAPGRCSSYIGNCTVGNSATEPYLVVHHIILSHAATVKLYRDKYKASQKGVIGIVIYAIWFVPKFKTVSSIRAASRALDFSFNWILHPVTYGEYPLSMRQLVENRLPKFTEEESNLIKGSLDFVGINYYTSYYADHVTSYSTIDLSYTTDSRVNETTEKNGTSIGQPTGVNWLYIYPKGIRNILLYVKRNYKDPPIYITENGFGDLNNSSQPVTDFLKDSMRIKYLSLHLSYTLEAIKKGVDVRGYSIWSFLDDFEWNSGYTIRFGITFVDERNGLQRILKNSAIWFKNFLQRKNNVATTLLSSY